MTAYVEPKVGQWWGDNDRRYKSWHHGVFERYGRIVSIEDGKARIDWNAGLPLPQNLTNVRLDRLKPTSTGYVYLGDDEDRPTFDEFGVQVV